MKASRRSFFGLMGSVPLAAKATIDAEIAKNAGAFAINGLGNTSVGLMGGQPCAPPGPYVPYETRLAGAADYVKMFGIPEVVEFDMRNKARRVEALDPDIACKASWSMSVKLMTQRERNYQREIWYIERAGWQQTARGALSKLLGFDWPW